MLLIAKLYKYLSSGFIFLCIMFVVVVFFWIRLLKCFQNFQSEPKTCNKMSLVYREKNNSTGCLITNKASCILKMLVLLSRAGFLLH